MYKIIIRGEAHTDYPHLHELDGVDCQDCFSEYFDGDETYAKNVTGGYMNFRFADNVLWAVTIYDSDRELTEEELEHLAEYTQGQWSDGIGEGFEQFPCYEADEEYETSYGDTTNEVYISPWYHGQVLFTEQRKVENQ